MANNQNLGFEHRFQFGAAGGSMDYTLDVLSSTLRKTSTVLDGTGSTGARDRREERTRSGIIGVAGTLTMAASPVALNYFLKYVLGGGTSGNWTVADSLPAFDCVEDAFQAGGASCFKYGELYVNRFTLPLRPSGGGGLLEFSLDVVGKTFVSNATWTSVALGVTVNDYPYTFYDSGSGASGGIKVKTSVGVIEIDEGELVIDNALDVRYRNSRTAASIRASDRLVSLMANVPLLQSGSHAMSVYFGDIAAADAEVKLNNGQTGGITTFSLNDLHLNDQGPEMRGRGDVPLVLSGLARANASTASVSATIA